MKRKILTTKSGEWEMEFIPWRQLIVGLLQPVNKVYPRPLVVWRNVDAESKEFLGCGVCLRGVGEIRLHVWPKVDTLIATRPGPMEAMASQAIEDFREGRTTPL